MKISKYAKLGFLIVVHEGPRDSAISKEKIFSRRMFIIMLFMNGLTDYWNRTKLH